MFIRIFHSAPRFQWQLVIAGMIMNCRAPKKNSIEADEASPARSVLIINKKSLLLLGYYFISFAIITLFVDFLVDILFSHNFVDRKSDI